MEVIESIDFELFNNNKKHYLPAVKELTCKTCSKIALPPYRINEVCYCNSCLKKLKPLIKKQAKPPTIFELLFIDKLKISCKICDETFNCKQMSSHSCQYKNKEQFLEKSAMNGSTLDISLSENINNFSHYNQKNIDFEVKSISSNGLRGGFEMINPAKQDFKFTNTVSFSNSPLDLKFINVFEKYYSMTRASNFCVIETLKKQTLIAYSTEAYSIDIKDIHNNQLIKSFTGHKNYITSIRHYHVGNVDYLLSSSMDRSVKLWNLNTLFCEVTIGNSFKSTFLFSSHLMLVNKTNYIVASVADPEPIKIYNLNGNTFKSINNGKDKVAYLDSWKDTTMLAEENFIISCNNTDVKLINFTTGKVYKSFQEKSCEPCWHFSCFVADSNLKSLLFESDNKGYLRIWDIHSGSITRSIKTPDCLVGILLWNDQYLLGAFKGGVRVIDLKTGSIAKTLAGNDNCLYGTLVKFMHSDLGECLMTSCGGGYKENKICLWN